MTSLKVAQVFFSSRGSQWTISSCELVMESHVLKMIVVSYECEKYPENAYKRRNY